MSAKITGKCLCGAVRYVAEGPPAVVAQCHCERCRRLSGTGHTVGAMFLSLAVDICGKLNEYTYVSDNGATVRRAFCANCGSPIYGSNTRLPDHITLTLGTMDDAAGLKVEVVVFANAAQHWDVLADDVMTFAAQPDWTPEQ